MKMIHEVHTILESGNYCLCIAIVIVTVPSVFFSNLKHDGILMLSTHVSQSAKSHSGYGQTVNVPRCRGEPVCLTISCNRQL